VKTFAAYSLKRLGVDAIDVYRPARLDPTVPIEDTIGAIADLVKAGYVRHIGLSEVGAETVARARKVHPIVDLQIEYSLASRGPEKKIFPALEELGISATLYGIFSRGLLTAASPPAPVIFERTCRASAETIAGRTRMRRRTSGVLPKSAA
jgi:aryl-alcohol dehydrogenase-like predicted oxidoreductase